jgi:hypothetical protein
VAGNESRRDPDLQTHNENGGVTSSKWKKRNEGVGFGSPTLTTFSSRDAGIGTNQGSFAVLCSDECHHENLIIDRLNRSRGQTVYHMTRSGLADLSRARERR